jgi:hypothetical protein
MALILATVTLAWLDAEAIWVDAAIPVTAMARTKKRTMVFIGLAPLFNKLGRTVIRKQDDD